MQTPPRVDTARWRFADNADLRRALTARLAAILAGRRPVARLLDDCPPFAALTVVVADLAAVAAAWTAFLGTHGTPPEPARFAEPGLAQEFALGPCALILFQPAAGTAAEHFLLRHGDGLYAATADHRAGLATLATLVTPPSAAASA